ncbi:hypothetical protein ASPWEDRAFT_458708 [Aspergillus wentii DTO 134E9]|uniref:Uncharacterized protein n=1 Tax=Aspergillus wentii DTO 134E9 TaxID=1073089 RepID=A0A1L9RRH0_ASPWE|nr:uncharacterized protein ASPWEDRAFT_458708 [Aspergillus wentii DTO 134E9]OJJ37550.1 hypothetical protein ASPWEDRAFT_458708 [Aspergillus wentii DTO 134E9]
MADGCPSPTLCCPPHCDRPTLLSASAHGHAWVSRTSPSLSPAFPPSLPSHSLFSSLSLLPKPNFFRLLPLLFFFSPLLLPLSSIIQHPPLLLFSSPPSSFTSLTLSSYNHST